MSGKGKASLDTSPRKTKGRPRPRPPARPKRKKKKPLSILDKMKSRIAEKIICLHFSKVRRKTEVSSTAMMGGGKEKKERRRTCRRKKHALPHSIGSIWLSPRGRKVQDELKGGGPFSSASGRKKKGKDGTLRSEKGGGRRAGRRGKKSPKEKPSSPGGKGGRDFFWPWRGKRSFLSKREMVFPGGTKRAKDAPLGPSYKGEPKGRRDYLKGAQRRADDGSALNQGGKEKGESPPTSREERSRHDRRGLPSWGREKKSRSRGWGEKTNDNYLATVTKNSKAKRPFFLSNRGNCRRSLVEKSEEVGREKRLEAFRDAAEEESKRGSAFSTGHIERSRVQDWSGHSSNREKTGGRSLFWGEKKEKGGLGKRDLS